MTLLSGTDVYAALGNSPRGLASAVAVARAAQFGPGDPPELRAARPAAASADSRAQVLGAHAPGRSGAVTASS
jgi:hypothetical protein